MAWISLRSTWTGTTGWPQQRVQNCVSASTRTSSVDRKFPPRFLADTSDFLDLPVHLLHAQFGSLALVSSLAFRKLTGSFFSGLRGRRDPGKSVHETDKNAIVRFLPRADKLS
jgi:hypothetical protein